MGFAILKYYRLMGDKGAGTEAICTDRLSLSPPTPGDVDGLFAICSDPRVWDHFPSKRHTNPEQTLSKIEKWSQGWETTGLDTWVVRLRGDPGVIGYGGCSLLHDQAWNLGYRFAPEVQGHGFATEVAREGIRRAHLSNPQLPIVAYLLEHNTASERVARKLGMSLMHRGPDAGNPDLSAVRLVYSHRSLTDAQLGAVLQ